MAARLVEPCLARRIRGSAPGDAISNDVSPRVAARGESACPDSVFRQLPGRVLRRSRDRALAVPDGRGLAVRVRARGYLLEHRADRAADCKSRAGPCRRSGRCAAACVQRTHALDAGQRLGRVVPARRLQSGRGCEDGAQRAPEPDHSRYRGWGNIRSIGLRAAASARHGTRHDRRGRRSCGAPRIRLELSGFSIRRAWTSTITLCAVKLIIQPLVVWVLAILLKLPALELQSVVLVASMSVGVERIPHGGEVSGATGRDRQQYRAVQRLRRVHDATVARRAAGRGMSAR